MLSYNNALSLFILGRGVFFPVEWLKVCRRVAPLGFTQGVDDERCGNNNDAAQHKPKIVHNQIPIHTGHLSMKNTP